MIYLALAVACGLAIGMIFKLAGRRGMDRLELLTANYLSALVVAGMLLMAEGSMQEGLQLTPGLIVLGVMAGVLFIAGFFVLSLATDLAGMGLAVGVMRVSVVVPFLASWWIWNEVPSIAQGAGLVLAAAAFFMIATRDRGAEGGAGEHATSISPARIFGILLLVFIAGGLVDTLMKAFDEIYADTNSRSLFLLMVFGVAAVVGIVIKSRDYAAGARPEPSTLGWGVLLGVANYGSVAFLLGAIRALSGPFVFPANNISIVIGAALLGVFFWQERLSRMNWIGLITASLALLLLNF